MIVLSPFSIKKLISISALCPSVVPPNKKTKGRINHGVINAKITSTKKPIHFPSSPAKNGVGFCSGCRVGGTSSLIGSCCCRPCWGNPASTCWYEAPFFDIFHGIFPVRFAPFTIHPKQINPSKNTGNIMKQIGPITQLPPTTPFPRWF